MDVGTGLAAFGVAAGSAKVIEKILGPTSDYIGDNVRGWAERRIANVNNIFQKAEEKLGDKIEEEGTVPPKVLKEIFDEGSFCDDELGQEYFGGVLASSRTSVSRDDRGAVYAALVGRMTTYQIRAHYIFYHATKQIYNGLPISIATPSHRDQLEVFIPFEAFLNSMGFVLEETPIVSPILTHIFFGLVKDELLGNNFSYGQDDFIKSKFSNAPGSGFLFQPSVLGVELFHWAYGMGNIDVRRFFDLTISFAPKPEVFFPYGAVATRPFVAPPQST